MYIDLNGYLIYEGLRDDIEKTNSLSLAELLIAFSLYHYKYRNTAQGKHKLFSTQLFQLIGYLRNKNELIHLLLRSKSIYIKSLYFWNYYSNIIVGNTNLLKKKIIQKLPSLIHDK